MKKYILVVFMLILSICSYAESSKAEGETMQKFLQHRENVTKTLCLCNQFNN